MVRAGNLVIDTRVLAHLSGTALNLTFKEFELLKFTALHPGRVFSRAQLLPKCGVMTPTTAAPAPWMYMYVVCVPS